MKNKLWIRFNYNDEEFEDYNIIKYNIYEKLGYVLLTYHNEEMKSNVCRPVYLDGVEFIEICQDGICTEIINIKKGE